MVGNVGFAARHKHILCFRNQTSMQPKTSKQSKQHVFIVSQLIIDYLHHIIFNICLCVYIYIYHFGSSLYSRCFLLMFQASGYQKLTELGAAKLRKARGF